jgi:iron complex outermembrane receptor protein
LSSRIRAGVVLGALLAVFGVSHSVSGVRPSRAGARTRVYAPVTDTVRGRVTDEQGKPLAGAQVVVSELDRRTRTDRDGGFLLASIPTGARTIVFSYPGYQTVVRTLGSDAGSTLDVRLRATPFQLEPVTVTAARAPVAPAVSPLATSVLGPERLRREHSISISHTLESLAGVRTLGTGEYVGKPVLRGLSGARVLVAESGQRLEDYSWSDEDAPSIDAQLTERVEVVRGPASVLYGSDAIGGVVNVIPESVPDALGGQSFMRTGFEAYGASNNLELGGVARIEGASGAWGWRAAAIGRFAEDMTTPTGKLHNTGLFAGDGEAVVGARGNWGSGSLRFAHYGGEFKLLEANAAPPTAFHALLREEEGGPVRKLMDERVQLAWTLPLTHVRLESHAQWQRHSLIEVSDEPGVLAVPGKETVQFDLLLNTLTAEFLAHHEGGVLQGTIGVSGELQSNDTRGPIALIPDAAIDAAGVFAYERIAIQRLSIAGGARVDARQVDANASSALLLAATTRDYTPVTGTLGAVLDLGGGLSLHGNAGSSWRAPTLFELFANGPRIGDARYDIGRADLKAEHGIGLDASVLLSRSGLVAQAALFRNRIDDFIFPRATGEVRNGLRVYHYAQAPALLTGGEVSIEVEATRHLTLRGRFDTVRGANRETNEPLPFVPPPRVDVNPELHSAQIGWAQQAYVGLDTEVVWAQHRTPALDRATDGYVLLHVDGGFSRNIGARSYRIQVRLRNLTNKAYRDYLSRYKEFADNQGRNIVLRIATDM